MGIAGRILGEFLHEDTGAKDVNAIFPRCGRRISWYLHRIGFIYVYNVYLIELGHAWALPGGRLKIPIEENVKLDPERNRCSLSD
jgi:hypothetical protein